MGKKTQPRGAAATSLQRDGFVLLKIPRACQVAIEQVCRDEQSRASVTFKEVFQTRDGPDGTRFQRRCLKKHDETLSQHIVAILTREHLWSNKHALCKPHLMKSTPKSDDTKGASQEPHSDSTVPGTLFRKITHQKIKSDAHLYFLIHRQMEDRKA